MKKDKKKQKEEEDAGQEEDKVKRGGGGVIWRRMTYLFEKDIMWVWNKFLFGLRYHILLGLVDQAASIIPNSSYQLLEMVLS